MALSYLPVDRDQLFLMPPDVRAWLPEGHLAWLVIEAVASVDTGALHDAHPNTGVGRRAYDPDMLLALLLYAYCTGLRSSRAIERRCEIDVAFRVICANWKPDHTTIARFRQSHQEVAVELFIQVLALCGEAGVASVGVVAVDGTKIAADAALAANRTREWIESEVRSMMEQAEATDRAEDQAFGPDRRGDELPAGLADPTTRKARLEAAAAQLRARQDQAHAGTDGGVEGGPVSDGGGLAAAEAAVRREDQRADVKAQQRAAKQAEAQTKGHKMRGRRPGAQTPGQRRAAKALARKRAKAERRAAAQTVAAGKAKANTTDPDSRIMKTASGWVQGYNAQAAVNEQGVVLAVTVTQQANDLHQCVPMMAVVRANLDLAGLGDHDIGVVVMDAGYLSAENLTAPGPDRLIATGKSRSLGGKGSVTGEVPDGASPIEAMEHRLRTPAGRSIYKLRSQLVEPYFGVVKDARGYRRFMRRGLASAQAEWILIASAHNLMKLFAAKAAAA